MPTRLTTQTEGNVSDLWAEVRRIEARESYYLTTAGGRVSGPVEFGDFVQLEHIGPRAPSVPRADTVRLYAKDNGHVYALDWNGIEYDLTSAGSVEIVTVPTPTAQNQMLLANGSLAWSLLTAPTGQGQVLVAGTSPYTPSWATTFPVSMTFSAGLTASNDITIATGRGIIHPDASLDDVLKFDGTRFVPGVVSGGGSMPTATQQGSVLVSNAALNYVEVSARTAGRILVGSGTTLASVAVSGDVTLSSIGAATVIAIRGYSVQNTAPSNGQVLRWSSTNSRWEPANIATIESISVVTASVSDVEPTDGECDSAFGTPAVLGSGFLGLLNDGGGRVWLCAVVGTTWQRMRLYLATP